MSPTYSKNWNIFGQSSHQLRAPIFKMSDQPPCLTIRLIHN